MKNLFKNIYALAILAKAPIVSCIFCVLGMLFIALLIEQRQLSDAYKRIYLLKKQYLMYQDQTQNEQTKSNGEQVRLNRDHARLRKNAAEFYKAQKVHNVIDSVVDADATSQVPSVITSPKKKSTNRNNKRKSHHPLKGHFKSPIPKKLFWLSSRFGPRKKPNGSWGFHYGIDMAALKGTEVQASADGIIEQAGYISGFGNMILVRHRMKGYKTRYAHLQKILVKKGQVVRRGERIGTVGDTGFTIKNGKDASHLHFEIFEKGRQINPLHLIG